MTAVHDESCDLDHDCSCTPSPVDDATAVALALETIAEYRDSIDEVVADLMGRTTSIQERALIGDALDQLRQVVGNASAWANDRLVSAMNARRLDRLDDLDGVVPIERYASKARKAWDNDNLRSSAFGRLYARAAQAAEQAEGPGLVDPTTGERAPGWAEAIAAVAEVWNLSGNNARITALKALGLDPDEFCQPGKTNWNVRYVRGDT